MTDMTDGARASELRKRVKTLLAQAEILDPPYPHDSRMGYNQHKAKLMLDPEFRHEYEALEAEYQRIRREYKL